jgi:DNA-binding LytR/AlgR family response regulator
MPNDGAFRLIKQFPYEQRPFLVILLSNPELDKYLRPSLLGELYGTGYLVKGVFNNEELIKVVEKVHREVQKKLVEDFKTELLEAAARFSLQPLMKEPGTTPSKQELSAEQTETEQIEEVPPREEPFFVATVTKNNEKVKVEIPWEWVIFTEYAKNDVHIHYFADGNLPEIVGKETALKYHKIATVRSTKDLIPSSFIQPHRSYWVQQKFITSVSTTSIYMITGKRISLSQNNRQRVIEALEWASEQFTISNELLKTLQSVQKKLQQKEKTIKKTKQKKVQKKEMVREKTEQKKLDIGNKLGGGHKGVRKTLVHTPLF